MASGFFKKEVCNGVSTSIWYDIWSPKGIKIDVVGKRGCTDLGIWGQSFVEVELQTHIKHNHRHTPYNVVEVAIEDKQSKGILIGDDVVYGGKKGIRFGQI